LSSFQVLRAPPAARAGGLDLDQQLPVGELAPGRLPDLRV
jgi:hypothetical protein